MNRRSFIQKASISAAGMVSAYHIPLSAQNKKLRIGLIGCGWYGLVITKAAFNVGGIEIIAVCDVDTNHLKSCYDGSFAGRYMVASGHYT